MALFDFFKKKKKIKEKEIEKKEVKTEKKEKTKEKKVPGKKEIIKPEIKKPKKIISERVEQILHSPHVTEKATALADKNKYVFKVWQRANKIEIKKAIKGLYGVDVVGVKIINVPRRKRRLGRQLGWRKGYKKAVVRLEKGQKIEVLPR